MKQAIRCSRMTTVLLAALMLCAFRQVGSNEDPSLPYGEEAFEAFDLATSNDVIGTMRAANQGDVAAQYAMYLVAQNGLHGRQVNFEVSASFLRKANSQGPYETETVTQFIPGGGGQQAQARTVQRPVNARVRVFERAYGECVGDILGTRPNPAACGATGPDRERRKAAWLSAAGRALP